MKPPTCKVCQKAHWTYDGHSVSDVTVPEYVEDMARGALGRESSASEERGRGDSAVASPIPRTATSGAEPSRSTCNACNKPLHNRGKVCNACRQRAYRERSRE